VLFPNPRKLTNNRLIQASNELWEMDIKYGYIAGEGRFFFLAFLNIKRTGIFRY
jgi:putative transposase